MEPPVEGRILCAPRILTPPVLVDYIFIQAAAIPVRAVPIVQLVRPRSRCARRGRTAPTPPRRLCVQLATTAPPDQPLSRRARRGGTSPLPPRRLCVQLATNAPPDRQLSIPARSTPIRPARGCHPQVIAPHVVLAPIRLGRGFWGATVAPHLLYGHRHGSGSYVQDLRSWYVLHGHGCTRCRHVCAL